MTVSEIRTRVGLVLRCSYDVMFQRRIHPHPPTMSPICLLPVFTPLFPLGFRVVSPHWLLAP